MTEAALQHLRDKQDVDGVRKHAWTLDRAITKMVDAPEGMTVTRAPIWMTWSTEAEVFSHTPLCEAPDTSFTP